MLPAEIALGLMLAITGLPMLALGLLYLLRAIIRSKDDRGK